MARISAIVPTYNRAAILREAIDAIQHQTRPIDEIIVVDDGSTDETRTLVAGLSGPIQYVYQPNGGKSAALNNALTRCNGDYIWICDDDDIALPRAAELLSDALDRNSAAGFAFGRYNMFSVKSDGKKNIFEPGYWPDLDDKCFLLSLLEDCYIFQNAVLVRRSAYQAVGPFRTDLIRSQDYEMMIRLALSFEAIYVPQVLFLQRYHPGARGSSIDRFDASQQMSRWIHYDQSFFCELYRTIPLGMFTRSTAGLSAGLAERAALLQRAAIYARKKLWDHTFGDLQGAIALGAYGPLTEGERDTCRRFLLSRFGCDEVVTVPKIAAELRSLAKGTYFGRSVVRAITEPLLWHSRHAVAEGNLRLGLGFATLLTAVHGYRGLAMMIGSRLRPEG